MDKKVSELQQSLYRAAKADGTRKFYSLYDKLCREDIMQEAWNRVKANRGSAGIDGRTIEDVEREGVDAFLKHTAEELRTHAYKPSPVRRVWIPKPNGKMRGLGIPTVKDRVVQTAVRLLLEPIFEQDFEPNSYGFRPGKSPLDAVTETVRWLNFGYEHIIDADITACFDNIPKGELIEQITGRIADGSILHMIKQWIETGVMEGGIVSHTEQGTPQGSPISPLLANVFLDRLDKEWKQYGRSTDTHLVRFADDFIIMGKQEMAEHLHRLETIIAGMKLTLSGEKTRVVEAEKGFDFLGFRFVRHYSVRRKKRVTRWFPSGRSRERIREKLRSLTQTDRLSNRSPYDARNEVIVVLRGWGEYYRHSMSSVILGQIWEYANVRIARMYRRWKQKRYFTGKYRELVRKRLSVDHTRPGSVPYAFKAAR